MKLCEIKLEGAGLRLLVSLPVVMVLLLLSTGATAQAEPSQQVSAAEQVGAAAVGTTYNVTSTKCTGLLAILLIRCSNSAKN